MLSKMERDGFIRRTRWRENILYKVVHLTELGKEMMEVVRTLDIDENAPYEEIEQAFLGTTKKFMIDYGPLYRQCNAIRISLRDNSPHMHPWLRRDRVMLAFPELGFASPIVVCRLRHDDVDDDILDRYPEDE